MSVTNDINSTEKLLNVIRGKEQESSAAKGKTVLPLPRKKPAPKESPALPALFGSKKRYTVGVDIGKEHIRLAKTVKASDGRPVLVDQKIVKLSLLMSHDSPEFKSLFKSALIAFCGTLNNCSIWTMMSAGEVNVHHLKIPRVPKKQLENVIYWTAKKENPFDEKEIFFDYEMQGEIVDQGVPKLSVMVYTCPKAEVEKVKAIFSEIGITLAGITIAPFAIQNIFRTRWMKVSEATFASLFIGHDFSRIDIYHKDNLVMTRGIKTGISSMTEEIADVVSEKTGKVSVDRDEAKKILFSLVDPDAGKLKETDVGFDLKEEDKFAMITPALERLSRQVERTLEHHASTAGAQRVEKLFISLAMNVYNPILNYISDQLGTKAEHFDPFRQQSAHAAAESLKLSEKVGLVPVLGLSFSDNSHTPNALFTYKDKNREESVKQINRGIFAAFAAMMVICLAVLIYQVIEAGNLSSSLKTLNKELTTLDPNLAPEKMAVLREKVRVKKELSRLYAQRHLGMATIGDISMLTPDNIHLLKLKISTGKTPPKEITDKTAKEVSEDMILEGVLYGDRKMLDQYVAKLENSLILSQVSVQKSNTATVKKVEVLYFTIIAKIG